MNVAIYARGANTKEQTISYQIKTCEEFVVGKNGQIVEIYSDEGFSAHDNKRPELLRLLNDATKQEFDTVVVSNYSRLFRNVLKIKEFEQGLAQLDIKLIVVDKL